MGSKRRRDLTLKMKMQVIREVDYGLLKQSQLAEKFSIAQPTISAIIANRKKIEAAISESTGYTPSRKRTRKGKNEDIDDALIKWTREAESQDIKITGPALQSKAKQLAESMGYSDFKGSSGWLQRFKVRYGVKFGCKTNPAVSKCEEHMAVSNCEEDMVGSRCEEHKAGSKCEERMDGFESAHTDFTNETYWPALLKVHSTKNILFLKEFALFYKALPSDVPFIKNDSHNTSRLTLLAAFNMEGSEKLPLLVVGKSPEPSSISKFKTMPIFYYQEEQGRITAEIYEKWIKEVDKHFIQQKKRVSVLVPPSCTDWKISGLKAVKMILLPLGVGENLLQDRSIVQSLILHYRTEILHKMVQCCDNGIPFSTNLLEASLFLDSAWKNVPASVVRYSFRDAGDNGLNATVLEDSRSVLTTRVLEEAEKRGLTTGSLFREYISLEESMSPMNGEFVEPLNEMEIKQEIVCEGYDEDEIERAPISMEDAGDAIKTLQYFFMEHEEAHIPLHHLDEINKFHKKIFLQKQHKIGS